MSKIIKNDARFFYNSSRFSICPGKSTTWHNHHDTELFFILSGEGKIKIDDEEVHIKSGDIIELLPLKRHIIYNENKNTILEICNFWWNDEHNFRVSIKEKFLTGNITSNTEINFILPSFTTPNGNLHVGHIAGPLLAADILNRAYYIQNKESYFISGTIGYQTQVQVKADKLNKTFLETSLFFSKNIQDSLQSIDIEADCFITLKNKDDFFEMVDLFINRLFEKLLLEKKEDEVYYCVQCEKYLFEANIIGNCPHCDHTVNAECEHCYEYFNEGSLKTPTCLTCKEKPKLKKLERYFISLNHFRGIIEDLYHKNSYEGISRFFVERILSAELPDIPITILAEQGIPFKNENFIGHVIYSAIELVPRFLVSLKILMKDKLNTDEWESILMSKNTNLDLLFGVDNLYLRCIIFPILLSAFNNKLINSINFIANDFYNLEGSKFSTSRNNVVSVEELKILYDLDYIRYYIAMNRPEFYSTNFCKLQLKNFVENGVLKKYVDYAYQLNQEINGKFNGEIPEAGSWDNFHYSYQKFLDVNIPLALTYINQDKVSLTAFINLISTMIEFSLSFFEAGLCTAMPNTYSRTFYALYAKGIVSLSILLFPVCPGISKKIQLLFHADIDDFPLSVEHLNKWRENENKFKQLKKHWK